MDVSQILVRAQRQEKKNYLVQRDFSDKEILGQAYINWQVAQADLIKAVKVAPDQLLAAYGEFLLAFARIANQRQWAYKLLLDETTIANFKNKWQAPSQSSVFLIMNQLVNKSFFSNDMEAFTHAWHIIIKFGLVELQISETELDAWIKEG